MADSPERGRARQDVARAGIHGVRWLGAARIAAEAAGFGAAIVLARLVPPADFGSFAVVAIAFLLAGTIAGDGVTASVVRLERVSRGHLESASFVSIAVGLLGTAVVLVVAAIVSAVTQSELPGLLLLASPCFAIAAIAAVSRAILQQRLAFRRLGAIDTIAALAGIASSVGLALAGLDAAALIIGALAGQAVAAVLSLGAASMPRPQWNAELREITGFGFPNAAAGVASTLSQNVDYAVLAARSDPATVGFYWRGYQLGVEAQRKLSGVLAALGLPLYSRLEHLADRLALRSRLVRLQTLVVTPPLVALIVLAPILVPVVFGPRWEPAVAPTQILAVAGLISAAQTGVGPLIASLGRPGAMLRWNLGNIVVLGVGVFIAAPYGLTALSVTVLSLRLLRFVASYELLLRPIAGIPRRALAADLGPAVISGAVALGTAMVLKETVLDTVPDIVEVLAVGGAIACSYLLALRLVFPQAFGQLTAVIGQLLSRSRSGTTPPETGTATIP